MIWVVFYKKNFHQYRQYLDFFSYFSNESFTNFSWSGADFKCTKTLFVPICSSPYAHLKRVYNSSISQISIDTDFCWILKDFIPNFLIFRIKEESEMVRLETSLKILTICRKPNPSKYKIVVILKIFLLKRFLPSPSTWWRWYYEPESLFSSDRTSFFKGRATTKFAPRNLIWTSHFIKTSIAVQPLNLFRKNSKPNIHPITAC